MRGLSKNVSNKVMTPVFLMTIMQLHWLHCLINFIMMHYSQHNALCTIKIKMNENLSNNQVIKFQNWTCDTCDYNTWHALDHHSWKWMKLMILLENLTFMGHLSMPLQHNVNNENPNWPIRVNKVMIVHRAVWGSVIASLPNLII